jgi:peptide-methionine (S)-S-oxide reductase
MPKFALLPLMAFSASAALIVAATLSVSAESAVVAPAPKAAAPQTQGGSHTIILAGGCFWGVQAVFEHVRGVDRAVSGYTGGSKANPTYEDVSSGTTGNAESVAVTYDPSQVGLGELLRIYFSVAHDPTEINRQGPDEGTQYRSEIFASDAADAAFAKAYIAQLDAAKTFPRPLATKVETGAHFYPAEGYHQDYAYLHPGEPYIAYNDAPKVENLKRLFAQSYRATPVLVAAK